MSVWQVWQLAFERMTLRDDGDELEMRAAAEHELDVSFPNYGVFWRYHIIPATNRPANIELRKDAAPVIAKMSELSHSLLNDLVNAADSLVRIRDGDLGGERFRNCTDGIKSDGDAVQKFTDLQKHIEGSLADALGRRIEIWSIADWQNKWSPAREKIIGYRNHLTHRGNPQVMLMPQADGKPVPYVLHQDYVIRGRDLTQDEQKAIHHSTPEKSARFADVCEELHRDSIIWLNNAYGEIIRALQPLLADEEYHWLWGWDTPNRGRHSCPGSGTKGIFHSSPAGSGIGFFPGSGHAGS